jgi:hypothetical protein
MVRLTAPVPAAVAPPVPAVAPTPPAAPVAVAETPDAAGPVAVAVAEPQPVAPAPAKKPAGKLQLPSDAERAKLAELEGLVAAKKFKDASYAVDVAMRLQLSDVGSSYAALLATEAQCGNRSLEDAKPRYRQITVRSHVEAAEKFCAEYGVSLP